MHIFFYVIDCLRPDYVGAYNPAITNTPHLDEFAQEALQFRHAYANDTWSKPNAVSLLTGYYADSVGMMQRTRILVPEVPTLAEALADAGYATIGITANAFVSPVFGLDRGFETFEMHRHHHRAVEVVSGKQLNRRAFELLTDRLEQDKSPVFCMVWNMDVHSPYFDRSLLDDGLEPEVKTYADLPADFARAEAAALYQKMVTYTDSQFGTFIASLREAGIYEESAIFLLSDHGESLGEHHQIEHGNLPFPEETHIVLLVKAPDVQPRQVDAITELVDIPKTVYELVGIPPKWPLPGESFQNLIMNSDASFKGHSWAYAEGQKDPDANKYASVLTKEWHYLDVLRAEDVNRPSLLAFVRQIRKYSPRCYFPVSDVIDKDYDSLPSALNAPLFFLGARLRLAGRRMKNRRFFNKYVKYSKSNNYDGDLEAHLRLLGYLE